MLVIMLSYKYTHHEDILGASLQNVVLFKSYLIIVVKRAKMVRPQLTVSDSEAGKKQTISLFSIKLKSTPMLLSTSVALSHRIVVLFDKTVASVKVFSLLIWSFSLIAKS